jgi:hypothetical protein
MATPWISSRSASASARQKRSAARQVDSAHGEGSAPSRRARRSGRHALGARAPPRRQRVHPRIHHVLQPGARRGLRVAAVQREVPRARLRLDHLPGHVVLDRVEAQRAPGGQQLALLARIGRRRAMPRGVQPPDGEVAGAEGDHARQRCRAGADRGRVRARRLVPARMGHFGYTREVSSIPRVARCAADSRARACVRCGLVHFELPAGPRRTGGGGRICSWRSGILVSPGRAGHLA